MERIRGKKAAVSVEHYPERDCTSVVVCCEDRPGLFASITGVLTSLRFDILNARIFTASDGRILDVFRISHHGRSELVMAEQKWAKFRAVLDGVLEGKIDVAALVGANKPSLFLQKTRAQGFHGGPISTTRRPTISRSSRFSQKTASAYLFTITYALHRLGLVDSRRENFHQRRSGGGCFLRHR